jgi:multicomponent Na+:H+ antiporter subunit F
MILAGAIIGLSMLLLLVRAVLGPTIFDRILAVNVFGTNVVVLILLLAFIFETPSFIDMALVYALLNFVATLGFLRFFKVGKFDE